MNDQPSTPSRKSLGARTPEPGRRTSPSFVDRVMADVAALPGPTPSRSFAAAVRARGAGDAAAALWSGWHLGTLRGRRVDPRRRVRALALVFGVATALLAGGSIAAAGMVHVSQRVVEMVALPAAPAEASSPVPSLEPRDATGAPDARDVSLAGPARPTTLRVDDDHDADVLPRAAADHDAGAPEAGALEEDDRGADGAEGEAGGERDEHDRGDNDREREEDDRTPPPDHPQEHRSDDADSHEGASPDAGSHDGDTEDSDPGDGDPDDGDGGSGGDDGSESGD